MNLIISIKIGVFDAGSTGTRLKIFAFEKGSLIKEETYKSDDIPTDNENNPFVKKGLHESSNTEIENTIKYLLNESKIEKNAFVGFYGTGGLRSIDTEKQEKIIESVKNATSGYNFIEYKIITGVEEALYALKGYEFLKPTTRHYSIIDMGGKSVQIIQRSGEEFKLVSLEMGVSNASCNQEKNNFSIFNLIKKLGIFLGASLVEIFDESNKNSIISCKDNKEIGFSCINALRYNKSLKGKTIKPAKCKSCSLAKNVVKRKELKCIDDKIKQKLDFKLDENNEVLLMSYYEELIKPNDEKNIDELMKIFDEKCSNNLSEDCLRMYYSIQFLKYIGVDSTLKLRILNTIKKLDISWPLGKALEIKKEFVDPIKNDIDSQFPMDNETTNHFK